MTVVSMIYFCDITKAVKLFWQVDDLLQFKKSILRKFIEELMGKIIKKYVCENGDCSNKKINFKIFIMAKKSMIQREIKRKCLVNRFSKKRQLIKQQLHMLALSPDENNVYDETLKLQKKLQQLPRNSLQIRIKNRCWKTGRSRGYYRDFGLSRHVVREMAHEGMLPGVIKASW